MPAAHNLAATMASKASPSVVKEICYGFTLGLFDPCQFDPNADVCNIDPYLYPIRANFGVLLHKTGYSMT